MSTFQQAARTLLDCKDSGMVQPLLKRITERVGQGSISALEGRALNQLGAAMAVSLGGELPQPDGPVGAVIARASCPTFDDAPDGVYLLDVETDTGEVVKCRVPANKSQIVSILFKAAGVPEGSDVAALEGKRVRVSLGSWTGRDGIERVNVKKWFSATGGKQAASRADTHVQPESETDQLPLQAQAALQEPPRAMPRAAEMAHRLTDAFDDDIPF
jgi:hypothetical protein